MTALLTRRCKLCGDTKPIEEYRLVSTHGKRRRVLCDICHDITYKISKSASEQKGIVFDSTPPTIKYHYIIRKSDGIEIGAPTAKYSSTTSKRKYLVDKYFENDELAEVEIKWLERKRDKYSTQ